MGMAKAPVMYRIVDRRPLESSLSAYRKTRDPYIFLNSINFGHINIKRYLRDLHQNLTIEGATSRSPSELTSRLINNVVLDKVFLEGMTFSQTFRYILSHFEIVSEPVWDWKDFGDTIPESIEFKRVSSEYDEIFYDCFIKTFRIVLFEYLSANRREQFANSLPDIFRRRHRYMVFSVKYSGLNRVVEDLGLDDCLVQNVMERGLAAMGTHAVSLDNESDFNLLRLSAPDSCESLNLIQVFQEFILYRNPDYALDSCPFFLYYQGKIKDMKSVCQATPKNTYK